MKKFIIQIWGMFDQVYLFCTRLKCLEKISTNYNIFRVRLTRYKGREVVLSDGTSIKKNDLLIKIHLHNVRILEEMKNKDENFKKSLYLYKKVQESLPDLALYIIHHKNNQQIKGVIGITMINKGFRRLGFESVHFLVFRIYGINGLLFTQSTTFPILNTLLKVTRPLILITCLCQKI